MAMARIGSMKRKWWILLVVLLLAGIAYAATRGDEKEEKIRTANVTKGNIEDVVTAQGKLEPKEYVDVGVQVSGQIKTLHVDVSDMVKKGQLLAEIDPRIYQSRVEETGAQLKSLRAQVEAQAALLELANRQHERNQEMFKSQAISKDTLEQGEAGFKEASAKLNSLKAQADQTASQLSADRTNLEFTKIFAPMDGVVASMPVRAGQTINSVQSAPTLMQLANLDIMTVRAQVAEADIPRVELGMPAYFTTLGDMEHKWKGVVQLIQPSPVVVNDVVLYDVLIDVENPEHQLMNGMSTQVFFQLGSAQDVAVLPMEALGKRLPQEDSDVGKAYEVKMQNEKTRTVFVGLMDRTNAEIKGGLNVGEVVVVPERAKPASTRGQSGRLPPGMSGPRL